MQQADMCPNPFSFSIALRACAGWKELGQGKQIHAHIIKTGFETDTVLGNALIDTYARCESIEDAFEAFDRMPDLDVISWNTIIAGCGKVGFGKEALLFFREMQSKAVKPDQYTFASVLATCASMALLDNGKQVHAHILRKGFQLNVYMMNALIDVYAKCGSIIYSRYVFDRIPLRVLISWTTMIAGYARHGYGKEAIKVFQEMQLAGILPDYITFVGVLSACSHAGLINEGWYYFNSMSRDYGISPTSEHYACMVDLLGRVGHLDEAHELISTMSIEPEASVWGALLSACRVCVNLELGKLAAERLFELKPQNAGTYVFLSNIDSASGRWDAATKMRSLMKNGGIKKDQGRS